MLERMSPDSIAVVRQLLANGYEAYFVGGCVRDAWLGRPIQDIDIATSATPQQVMECFPRTAPTGLQHGTVMVIGEQGTYEVTTFRIESHYEAYRRPAEVEFTLDLVRDLERRDFTMNAMAMNIAGQLIDPFDGQSDLAAGVLRCVGAAEQRFREDALRMLRCVRFASTYALEVEANTWHALLTNAPLLRYIAMERVRSELQRMVAGAHPARAMRLLLASQLLAHLKRPWQLPVERWQANSALLEQLSALASQHQRWVLLMLVLAVPAEEVRRALQALTFSRAELRAVVDVVGLHAHVADQLVHIASESFADAPSLEHVHTKLVDRWKLAVVQYSQSVALDWLAVARLLGPEYVQPSAIERSFVLQTATDLLTNGEQWIAEMPITHLQQLAISGHDLMQACGRTAGPWMRPILEHLVNAVALGHIENHRDTLLCIGKQKISQGV